MKQATALLLCVLLTVSVLVGCGRKRAALIEQPENLYVADQAEVLSQTTEDYVVSRVSALKQACGGEIAVVTVDYLNDLTAEEYAYTLFNQWGIGDKSKNNGMMVLLVIGENACWLTPGYGIEDDFPSTLCTEYLGTYLWQYQNAGDCDTGVTRLVDALIDWYCDYYKVTVAGSTQSDLITDFAINSGYGSPYPESAQEESNGLFSGSGILTILAIGFVIFLLLQNGSDKPRKRSFFIPLLIANAILNQNKTGTHYSSGATHHSSSGSFHVGGTSRPGGGHFGGGGTHGGGGGFRG